MDKDKTVSAEDWGRLAVSLPGWWWRPGMRCVVPPRHDGATGYQSRVTDAGWLSHDDGRWPDPDDPATAGCLLALLGPCVVTANGPNGVRVGIDRGFGAGVSGKVFGSLEDTLGRACIAAAEALGRWPGGEG
jgi:hypothetical protein